MLAKDGSIVINKDLPIIKFSEKTVSNENANKDLRFLQLGQ